MLKDKNIVEALNRVLTESFGCRCWITGISIKIPTSTLEHIPLQGYFTYGFSFVSKVNLIENDYSHIWVKIVSSKEHQTYFGTPNYVHEGITCYKSSLQKELFQVMLEHS